VIESGPAVPMSFEVLKFRQHRPLLWAVRQKSFTHPSESKVQNLGSEALCSLGNGSELVLSLGSRGFA